MTLTKKYLMLIDLLKKEYNTNITETVGKIPSITGLPTITELTAVENKITCVSNLVRKKTDMMQKYQTLNLSTLQYLIIISLWVKYLIQSSKIRLINLLLLGL